MKELKVDEHNRNYEILAYLLIASNCDIAHVWLLFKKITYSLFYDNF